jgi:hypothetical protein
MQVPRTVAMAWELASCAMVAVLVVILDKSSAAALLASRCCGSRGILALF